MFKTFRIIRKAVKLTRAVRKTEMGRKIAPAQAFGFFYRTLRKRSR